MSRECEQDSVVREGEEEECGNVWEGSRLHLDLICEQNESAALR